MARLFGNPVRGRIGPPGQPDSTSRFVVTSRFGPRSVQMPDGTTRTDFHDGLDVDNGGAPGDPIIACDGGSVYQAGFVQSAGGAGIVRIRHADGWTTGYAHMNSILVKVGQTVSKGQQIGTLGSTGWVTGPHLHFDTTDPGGTRRDPWPLLEQNGGDVKIQGTWVRHIINRDCAITDGANFRQGPWVNTTTGAPLTQYPAGTGFIPTVEVKGQSVGTAADRDRWYGGWLYENGVGWQFGYFHSSVLPRTADKQGVRFSRGEETSGATPAQVDAAEKAAADAVLEAAKKAAATYGAS